MANTTQDPIGELLREAFDETRTAAPTHAAESELAAYLERTLPRRRRRRIEDHLAACGECRELAVEGALAVREAEAAGHLDPAPAPGFLAWLGTLRPAHLALVAASLIAAASTLVLFRGPGRPADPALAAAGVSARALRAAGPEIASLAAGVARGEWPAVSGLESLVDLGEAARLRAAVGMAAEPLSPRWSAVRGAGTAFAWYPPAASAEAYEILLVDESERWIGDLELPAGEGEPPVEVPYPEAWEPLEPGRTYAWKVNSRRGGGWHASAWVPFRVLDDAAARALGEDLERAGRDPFLRAAVLLAAGVHDEGLELLAGLGGGPEARDLGRDVARAALQRARLPQEVAAKELERRYPPPEEER